MCDSLFMCMPARLSKVLSILSTVLPCENERLSKMFCMIRGLQHSPIKNTYTKIYTKERAHTGCPSKHRTRESLNIYSKKAEAAWVGGSITSTRDDKCQFSSCHHLTPLHRGWMEIYEWRTAGCYGVLELKLALSPPSRFRKDIQRTCKHG